MVARGWPARLLPPRLIHDNCSASCFVAMAKIEAQRRYGELKNTSFMPRCTVGALWDEQQIYVVMIIESKTYGGMHFSSILIIVMNWWWLGGSSQNLFRSGSEDLHDDIGTPSKHQFQ